MRPVALALAVLLARQEGPPTYTGSALIDQQISKGWADASIPNTGHSDDAEFLRRLSLDLVGSLPKPDEVLEFLKDSRADKRVVKIDQMLARPEYAHTWAELWENILVGYDQQSRNDSKRALYTWLRD